MVAAAGTRTRGADAEQGEEPGQQRREGQAEAGVGDLLPVVPGPGDPQHGEVGGRDDAEEAGGQAAFGPDPEALLHVRARRRGGVGGAGGAWGWGEAVGDVGEVGLVRHQLVDRQGHPAAEHGAEEQGDLQGGHDASPAVTLLGPPRKRGGGVPSAIFRIQASAPAYAASRARRMTCPMGVRYGAM